MNKHYQEEAVVASDAGAADDLRPPCFSDDALALRFAEAHADNRLYVATSSRWFCWQAARWRADDTLATFDLARSICRQAAAGCNKSKIAAALASAKTVAAVERLAKSDRRLAATIEQFDFNPDTFGTPPGEVT